MIAAVSGLIAGLTHALMGPDHVAAVTPLALEQRPNPWISGIRWGLGHSLGVGIVGLAFLYLRDVLPLHKISASGERLVGITLILIGAWAFKKALRIKLHTHRHEHGGSSHTHLHTHRQDPTHDHGSTAHAALGVGTLHGLAGSSHFIGVLPSLALPTTADSIAFLIGFGVGTILAMAGLTTLLGSFAHRLQQSATSAYRYTLATSACVTGGVGVFWLFSGGA
ncbi:MAG TPA: High-affinity nickel transporter [Candidatus Limnocylindria bacterium]|jgi:hypothetical protein|nr:High-affinity nickel transporter [Candidatus Limnocylindria bacterium]